MSCHRLILSSLTAAFFAAGLSTIALAEEAVDASAEVASPESTEVEVVETESASEATPQGSIPAEETIPAYELVWTGPVSLDTLVDERRDALRDRREAYFEARRAAHGIYSPWMDQRRRVSREYSDLMRRNYRVHRDAMKHIHDVYRSQFMPWSRSFSDWAEDRRYAIAMSNLDRQEYLDDLMFLHSPAFAFAPLW
jgi:hypothetical protein